MEQNALTLANRHTQRGQPAAHEQLGAPCELGARCLARVIPHAQSARLPSCSMRKLDRMAEGAAGIVQECGGKRACEIVHVKLCIGSDHLALGAGGLSRTAGERLDM
eukprot:5110146-Prymnesium_polylepis.1